MAHVKARAPGGALYVGPGRGGKKVTPSVTKKARARRAKQQEKRMSDYQKKIKTKKRKGGAPAKKVSKRNITV